MTVETNQGSFEPAIVIICAGPWSGELGRLAGVEIPVQPLRRMCFVTDPFDTIPHDAPRTIEMPNTFHFRPEGAGFMLGTSDQDEPYGCNTTMTQSRKACHLMSDSSCRTQKKAKENRSMKAVRLVEAHYP